MILHHFLGDGQAEARSLGPRRDVGLEQAVPLRRRQAGTVVGNLHGHRRAAVLDRHLDLAGRAGVVAGRPILVDRFGGVLQQVRQHLRGLMAVAHHLDRRFRQRAPELDVGVGDLMHEQRLPREVAEVLQAELGRRHPRERGELVDHPPDVPDLADDGVGALAEDLGIGQDLV